MTNQEQIKDLVSRKEALKKFLDIDAIAAWIAEEEKKTEAPDFWNDPKEAQKVVKGINARKSWVTAYKDVDAACGDLEVMGEFFDAGDATEEELVAQIAVAQKKVEDLEFKNMLRNESDRLDAVLSINAGAGGVEAQDCAEMLMRMYIRYAETHGYKVVISNTHSPHHLDSGAYNDRVRQCKTAVEQISRVKPIKFLAELTPEDWEQVQDAITDPIAKKRARHVVGEVARTAQAVEALKQGKIALFGELMTASHVSLRDDYEVTGKELDSLAEAAWQVEGVLGSRMTGGGFGGCTVSLVRDEAIETFKAFVGKEYEEKTGLKADFYVAEIGDGVMRLA